MPATGTRAPTLRPPSPGVAGVINTTQQRKQLAYLADQPEYVQRLAKRCGNTHQRIQEGFHFEWLHELGFNLDALGKDSPHRAYVTEWLGRPADPADIVIETTDGKVVHEVQAKVVESNSKRVGPNNGLIDRDYEGKVPVVPTATWSQRTRPSTGSPNVPQRASTASDTKTHANGSRTGSRSATSPPTPSPRANSPRRPTIPTGTSNSWRTTSSYAGWSQPRLLRVEPRW
jgi:hypothetical protein